MAYDGRGERIGLEVHRLEDASPFGRHTEGGEPIAGNRLRLDSPSALVQLEGQRSSHPATRHGLQKAQFQPDPAGHAIGQ
jgi:hypothetical protein